VLQPKSLFYHVHLRPRLITATIVGCAVFLVSPSLLSAAQFPPSTRALLAWDIGTGLYLILAWSMMLRANVDRMRARARVQDDGAVAILVLTVIAAAASLAAIFLELARRKHFDSQDQAWHLGLVALTILSSWLFIHTAFAIHYAHDFYRSLSRTGQPPLEFPRQAEPHYWEFLYFSFTIGTTSQTSDVQITAVGMRKLALLHAVVAFFFNTTVLALTINIAAGLI
jgi:uncharacterized membrane protein